MNNDVKIAPDLPPYPREFTPQDRLVAYWAMIQLRTAVPAVTDNWWKLLDMGHNRTEHINALLAREAAERTPETAPEPPPVVAQERPGGWLPYKDEA